MNSKKATVNVYDFLKERGLVAQVTNEDEIRKLLAQPKVRFYLGFDPTADSLHIGHCLILLVAHYLQEAGHCPYLLVGGATAMIGDPSGRIEMRQMMDEQTIRHNSQCFQNQMRHLVSFQGTNGAKMLNNAEWLLNLNWIYFLRTFGVHFSVNKMLAAEAFKVRWERGLSFFEFNYMLMQAYDFLHLFNEHQVVLQIGGNDQWSNIIAGVELIRRVHSKTVEGLTVPILTKSDGTKMGKSAQGALWLDPKKISPYHFYQYWLNIRDDDVENYLRLLTKIPLDEIANLIKTHHGKKINELKKLLAFKVTEMIHGRDQAELAQQQSIAAFEANNPTAMYTVKIKFDRTKTAISIIDILMSTNQATSRSAARRLVESGGVSIDEVKINDPHFCLSKTIIQRGEFFLTKGKKTRLRIVLE